MSMASYRYIGTDPLLIQHTALGQEIDGVFKVQVDCLSHLWSHGWHESPQHDWQVDNEDVLA
jgi:hypothetical protein